jgi:hypothetical protein
MKMISEVRENPFVVSKNYINQILEKEEKIFEETADGDNYPKSVSGDYEVLGKEAVQVRLNGYEITDPYGKEAKTVDTAIFLSLVDKIIVEKVEDINAFETKKPLVPKAIFLTKFLLFI